MCCSILSYINNFPAKIDIVSLWIFVILGGMVVLFDRYCCIRACIKVSGVH